MKPRLLIASLVANAALGLAALGLASWVVLEPRYWFEDAYAEQGPRGAQGPRGERGPRGPEGSVGPDAAEAFGQLDTDLIDLGGAVDEIETRLGEVETELDDRDDSILDSYGDDAEATLDEICDAIDSSRLFASNSAIEALLDDLQSACR